MLEYDVALAKGLPIGSGAIEGSCGHIVGQRMCGVGKHWTIEGAQAVLDLRCLDDEAAFVAQLGELELGRR